MLIATVRPDDGDEFVVKVAARDTLVWEKTTKPFRPFLDWLRNPDMTNLYRLVHIAGTRQGLLNGQTLAEFEKNNDVLFEEEDEENKEPDPTRPAASPETS